MSPQSLGPDASEEGELALCGGELEIRAPCGLTVLATASPSVYVYVFMCI